MIWQTRALAIALGVAAMLPKAYAFDSSVESKARALEKRAMEDDYLVDVDANAAERDLSLAIYICTDRCNPRLRAALYRDLGTVLGGIPRFQNAVAAFTQALTLDAAITVNPDLSTPPIAAAFAAAKRTSQTPLGARDAGPQ